MDRKHHVFIASLIFTILTTLRYSVNPFIRVFLIDISDQNYDLYTSFMRILGYILSASLIYVGYRIGKNADLKNEYNGVIRSLGVGWFASFILLGGSYLVSSNNLRYVLQFASTQGVLASYKVGAALFTTIFLGWVTRDGVDFKREFNHTILKPVLVYRGVILINIILTRVVSFQSLSGAGHTSIAWMISILGWITFPFWIYYASRMYSSGRLIDLESTYGSILYTIWLPSFVESTLAYLINVVFYYLRSGSIYDLFSIPQAYGLKIVDSFFGVFSLPLALLCYSYLSSKYRYIPKQSTNTEVIQPDSSLE